METSRTFEKEKSIEKEDTEIKEINKNTKEKINEENKTKN